MHVCRWSCAVIIQSLHPQTSPQPPGGGGVNTSGLRNWELGDIQGWDRARPGAKFWWYFRGRCNTNIVRNQCEVVIRRRNRNRGGGSLKWARPTRMSPRTTQPRQPKRPPQVNAHSQPHKSLRGKVRKSKSHLRPLLGRNEVSALMICSPLLFLLL